MNNIYPVLSKLWPIPIAALDWLLGLCLSGALCIAIYSMEKIWWEVGKKHKKTGLMSDNYTAVHWHCESHIILWYDDYLGWSLSFRSSQKDVKEVKMSVYATELLSGKASCMCIIRGGSKSVLETDFYLCSSCRWLIFTLLIIKSSFAQRSTSIFQRTVCSTV